MADGSNLKAKIGMDTGDFEKGAKRVTKAAQSMGKDIGTSLTDVGRAIGADAGLLGELASRIGNATTLFRGMASAGGSAASSLTKAMTGLGGAIAGLGITAAIVAFRELNNQAANFEQRLQGVNLAASAKAARETYRQSLYDSSGAGEAWANFTEQVKTRFSWGMTNVLTGTFSADKRAAAQKDAVDAARLASQRVDLQRRLDASVESQARFQKEINEQLLIARDRSKSSTERKAAEAQAVKLINDKYDEQLSIATALRDNAVAMGEITNNTDQETRDIAQANANILNIEAQRTQELTSMVRLENQITTSKTSQAQSAKETQEATEITLAAATQLGAKQRERKAIQDQNNAMMAAARFSLDGGLPSGPGIQPGQAQRMTVPALVRPVVDPQEWIDVSEELKGIIEDALGSIGDSIGQLMGDLATGGDAWGNFTNNAIQAFGEMATTVGKIAVSTGLATLGIKAALESLNPYVAIAAGTALIALGAAVRAGMANAASGSYSTSVASSAYSSSGTFGQSSFGREMEVKVTGTLTANGSKLVAVLNNERNRTDYTT